MAKLDRYLLLAILVVGFLYLFLDQGEDEDSREIIKKPPQPPPPPVVNPVQPPPPEAKPVPIRWADVKGERKQVLVTGAAGFIGMHLALQLTKRGNDVVGLDNFNSYYDTELKRDRAYELHKEGIPIVKGDVCDRELLVELFRKHRFTHVAHMAAQAGVRYSLKDPLAYVRSNVQCFVTLLEVVRTFPGVKVVYASSSSVYGRNTKVPFSVSDPIDLPSSLYAATKKANEDIARVYHNLYKIPLTGLRFFTVYGPWGRPDMAVYDFTEKMFAGKPINVYSHGVLQRDFTYVDDIVNGIIAAVNYGAQLEVFNLGKGHPEKVNELIAIIEQAFGRKAARNEMPMQPGDVAQTWADIEKTKEMLGFEPTISLKEGVSRWATWYLSYRDYREKGPFDRQNQFIEELNKADVKVINPPPAEAADDDDEP
eukprot:comp22315_c0_seq1/m.33153 comp22315_c0_seq1/g.33153  ORF comp22315_c0_seq1/g.33153 comp22315_c0_seq1/m.33153 type:complete len:425 (-) comp22315_c0_seq1:192-1466(-)